VPLQAPGPCVHSGLSFRSHRRSRVEEGDGYETKRSERWPSRYPARVLSPWAR
jgi:hypothetical protein